MVDPTREQYLFVDQITKSTDVQKIGSSKRLLRLSITLCRLLILLSSLHIHSTILHWLLLLLLGVTSPIWCSILWYLLLNRRLRSHCGGHSILSWWWSRRYLHTIVT